MDLAIYSLRNLHQKLWSQWVTQPDASEGCHTHGIWRPAREGNPTSNHYRLSYCQNPSLSSTRKTTINPLLFPYAFHRCYISQNLKESCNWHLEKRRQKQQCVSNQSKMHNPKVNTVSRVSMKLQWILQQRVADLQKKTDWRFLTGQFL